MLCEELEWLEGKFDDIVTALESPNLTEKERETLEQAYARLREVIKVHQDSGHDGKPCFEE